GEAQRPPHQGRAKRDQSPAEPDQQKHLQGQASQAVIRRYATRLKREDSRRLVAAFLFALFFQRANVFDQIVVLIPGEFAIERWHPFFAFADDDEEFVVRLFLDVV